MPPSKPFTRPQSVFLFILATLCLTGLDSVAKSMTATVNMTMLVWGRYFFSLLMVSCVLPFLGGITLLKTRQPVAQLGRSALLVGATAFMFQAVKYLPVALSYAISYISPLVVLLLAVIIFKERLTRIKMIGTVCGFIGVLIIIRPGFSAWHIAMLAPIGMAVCYASYQILTQIVSHQDNPVTSLFYITIGGTIITSLALPWAYQVLSLTDWLLLLSLAGFGTLGHFLLIVAYKGAEATLLAPFVYLQIIWAGIIDIFIFNTGFDLASILGTIIIISSGLVILRAAK